MSLRQVKKIVEKQQKPSEDKEQSDDSEGETKQNRFFGFSDESPDSDNPEEPIPEPPKPKQPTKKSKKKPQQKKPQANINIEELLPEITHQEQYEEVKTTPNDQCLKRTVQHFDSAAELQKIFQEKAKTKVSTHKKSLMLTPSLARPVGAINYLPIMDLKNTKFSFETSKSYLKLYPQYILCIESNDPGMLHDFSIRFPFHVESLYQLALLYKMQAKYEQVHQLVERVLYSFQLGFHQQFSPIGKNIAMEINATSLNRIFFKAIFMFIDCLGRKGCNRTALEFTKFLLCLDYKDPLGGLFLIDFYAISNRKYDFYLAFCERFMQEYYNKNKCISLPTAIYSLSMCKALVSGCFNITEKDVDQAFTLRNLDNLHKENANVCILSAVATFPVIAKTLLEKLAPSFVFTLEIEESRYDYSVLAEIYAVRTLELWRNENCLIWLKQAVEEAEIVGCKETSEVWEYSHLDVNDFSFTARNLIPQDIAFR
jgi:hypothetical protein